MDNKNKKSSVERILEQRNVTRRILQNLPEGHGDLVMIDFKTKEWVKIPLNLTDRFTEEINTLDKLIKKGKK